MIVNNIEFNGFDHDAKPEHPFEKHTYDKNLQATEADYKKDTVGRKYRNIPHCSSSAIDEYLANENLTLVIYLYQCVLFI